MTAFAISTENLGKSYRLGHRRSHHSTFRDALASLLKPPPRRLRSSGNTDSIWALRDLSFEVRHGEVLSIIGRNGSGKSTLLKILSRITEPTEGRARIRGRVASLLEVGTGFHPELSGRENIYLNGSILGMGKAEIDRKFDEIVAFTENERFLDTPVKRYSSGMYVRLAFAVAAHLDPEVLIVDEVLAVGDATFQRKCLGKMKEVSGTGRTILLVSHQMQAVMAMADRAMILDKGRMTRIGNTAEVVSHYMKMSRSHYDGDSLHHVVSADELILKHVAVTTETDENPLDVVQGQDLDIRLEFHCRSTIAEVDVSLAITNAEGVHLFSHSRSDQFKEYMTLRPGNHTLRMRMPTRNLRPGPHWLSFCVSKALEPLVDVRGIEIPTVILGPDADAVLESRRWGVVYIPCDWTS